MSLSMLSVFGPLFIYQLTSVAGVIEGPEAAGVAAHNEARRGEGASLPDVSWNEELYDLCVRNVKECKFEHDVTTLADKSPYGQNLFKSSGKTWKSDDVVKEAVRNWMAEKPDYDLNTNTCASGKVCGHYTQVVWKTSVKIGCAVNLDCPSVSTIVCCNYAPAGNYIGQRPYSVSAPPVNQNSQRPPVIVARPPSGTNPIPSDPQPTNPKVDKTCTFFRQICPGTGTPILNLDSITDDETCSKRCLAQVKPMCLSAMYKPDKQRCILRNVTCRKEDFKDRSDVDILVRSGDKYGLCPAVKGGYSDWSTWSKCSVTCGAGSHSRTRACDNPDPGTGGSCDGPNKELKTCKVVQCPVDGGFGAWGAWSACSATCGGTGVHTRTRSCDKPAPAHGGKKCEGDSEETKQCKFVHCSGQDPNNDNMCVFIRKTWNSPEKDNIEVLNGVKTEEDCSKKCIAQVDPFCWTAVYKPVKERCYLRNKACKEADMEMDVYTDVLIRSGDTGGRCPAVNGKLGDWGSWSKCTRTCGGGTRHRGKTCSVKPGTGGKCTPVTSSENCNTMACPSEEKWGDWTKWSACTATCGGVKGRTRTCKPGKICTGKDSDIESCNNPCPSKWSAWTAWSKCTADCGTGFQSRSRVCKEGPCIGDPTEGRACSVKQCPMTGCPKACTSTGGLCLDTDKNGVADACKCPEKKCSSKLSAGCDGSCASLGSICETQSPCPCCDPHSSCTQTVTSRLRNECTCNAGYTELGKTSKTKKCVRVITGTGCEACIKNGGTCYDENFNNAKDGCICPPHRSTKAEDCDITLVSVKCDESTFTVCYKHRNDPRFVELFKRLTEDKSKLYVQGKARTPSCSLAKKDDDYCIVFNKALQQTCGVTVQDTATYMKYEAMIKFQYVNELLTIDDFTTRAHCSFAKVANVASGKGIGVRSEAFSINAVKIMLLEFIPITDIAKSRVQLGDQFDSKRSAHTMSSSVDGLEIYALDADNRDLAITDIMVGAPMKMYIVADSTSDVTSLRVEHCVASDQYSLNSHEAQVEILVRDGCMVRDSPVDEQAFVVVDGSSWKMHSGQLPAPHMEGASYVFIHCAVRRCFGDDSECEPRSCSATMTPSSAILSAFFSPMFEHVITSIHVSRADMAEMADMADMAGTAFYQHEEDEETNIHDNVAHAPAAVPSSLLAGVLVAWAVVAVSVVLGVLVYRRRHTASKTKEKTNIKDYPDDSV